MRFFTARRLALVALLPALLIFSIIPGCAKQGEGDRCGDDSGHLDDSDCEDGLTCQPVDPSAGINRCCYPGGRVSNSRCVKVTSSANVAGASSTGGAAGSSGAAGSGGTSAGSGSATAGAAGASDASAGEAGSAESSAAGESGAGGG